MMILSVNNEKIILDFRKEIDSFSTVKQLTFQKKKELIKTKSKKATHYTLPPLKC